MALDIDSTALPNIVVPRTDVDRAPARSSSLLTEEHVTFRHNHSTSAEMLARPGRKPVVVACDRNIS